MARTIDHSTADQGLKGRGPRRAAGLAAGALLGAALLAGTILSQGRPATRPAGPPAAIYPVASDPHIYTVWDFREDHRLPRPEDASTSAEFRWDFGAGYPVAPSTFVPDQFTYREDHRNPASTLDWEQAERGQVAPALPAAIPAGTPALPTYRESHGLDGPPVHGTGIVGTSSRALYDGTSPGILELAAGDGGTPPGRLPFEYYA